MAVTDFNFLSFKQTQEEPFAKAENSSGVAMNGFFQIEFTNEKTQKQSRYQRQIDCNHCWKFHVSVKREQLEQAWNVLVPVFFEHQNKLHTLKITQGEHKPGSRVRDGAQITIYVPNSDNNAEGFSFYEQLAQEISAMLAKHEVPPGKQPNSDAALNPYISVRHEDTDRYGNYDPSLVINQNNPFNKAIYAHQSTIYENLIKGLDKGIKILSEKQQLLAPLGIPSPQRAQRVEVLANTINQLFEVKKELNVQLKNTTIDNNTADRVSERITGIFNNAQKQVTTHFSFKDTLNRALNAIMGVFGIQAKTFFSPSTKQTMKEAAAVALTSIPSFTR